MFSHMPVEKRLHSLDLLNMGRGGGGGKCRAQSVNRGNSCGGT